jgi:hypothetical protein
MNLKSREDLDELEKINLADNDHIFDLKFLCKGKDTLICLLYLKFLYMI